MSNTTAAESNTTSSNLKVFGGKEFVGLRNITDRRGGKGSGVNYNFEHNGAHYTIDEGKAVPVPKELALRIIRSYDVISEGPAFELCDLSECDSSGRHVLRTYAKEGIDTTVDGTFVETVGTVIQSGVLDQVETLISSCDSVPTLQSLIKKFGIDNSIDKDVRNGFVKACVQRIAALNRK